VLNFSVRSVTGLVAVLVKGRGRPKEAIEALRVEDVEGMEGLGVLHVAASRGRLEVCIYLVEELQVDVNGVDSKGSGFLGIHLLPVPCRWSTKSVPYFLVCDHVPDRWSTKAWLCKIYPRVLFYLHLQELDSSLYALISYLSCHAV
jgi:hypothetical protein